MKKIILLMVMVISLTACNMQFYNEDGFTIFGYGATLDRNQVLVQSHYSYMIEEEGTQRIYDEGKFYLPLTINNVTNQSIDVKVTEYRKNSYWTIIPANSFVKIE